MKVGLTAVAMVTLISGCKVYNAKYTGTAIAHPDSGFSGSSGSAGSAGDGGILTGAPDTGHAAQDEDGGSSVQQPPELPIENRDPASCSGGDCWWSSTSDGCRSAGLPTAKQRPDAARDGATSLADLYMGLTRLWIGETDLTGKASSTAWQSFGLDLDGRCTNSSTCPSEQNVQSCRAATMQIPFDGALCRDNTFASLQPLAAAAPEIGKRYGISESLFNCNLWRGSYNILWRISGYNGKADDSDVRVDFYTSPGLTQLPQWKCPEDGFADKYPAWRSVTPWQVDPATLVGPVQTNAKFPDSTVADPHAYVRDGYIVAELPDAARIRLADDGTMFRGWSMDVYRGVWVGNLYSGQDGQWRMRDGMIAGRIRSGDLIQSFRQIGLCPGVGLDGFYRDVVQYIDQNVDVLADGSVDTDRDCDAMSMAIAFEAQQATAGPAEAALPLVECCAPGVAIEDCNPKCGDGRLNGTEKCDTEIAAGRPGACPSSCATTDPCMPMKLSGSGCDAACVATPITSAGPQDGCCPNGANSTSDRDCAPKCGNGVIEAGESCDPPGSCPSCSSSDKCLVATVSGAAASCNLSCSFAVQTQCRSDDGCCPAGCSSSNDNDCSTSCANGRIDAHETCETRSSMTCPSSCTPSAPCQQVFMTGSSRNCNVSCSEVPITQAIVGDACCPPGASANTDSDCVVRCGNKIVEAGEQCDDGNMQSGDGCTPDCKIESPVDQCLAKIGPNDRPDCARCNCEKCQSNAVACYGASDPNATQNCAALVKCGLDHSCSTDACYCGTVDLASCLLLGLGNGPCMKEVEKAAGTSFAGDILTRSEDPSYAVGRANLLASCARTNCAAECGITQ